MNRIPKNVGVREAGLRDGLQSIDTILPTERKIEWIREAHAAGSKTLIEVGIGGCPHAPGTSGNASSEDLAFMLASMGIATGIDLERLLALRAKVAGWLAGEALHGTLWQAGLPRTFTSSAAAVSAVAA